MNKSTLILSTLSLMVAGQHALACTPDGKEGFLPKNNLSIPVGASFAGVDQKSFNAVIDRIEPIYRKIISQKGANLVVERRWTDPTVNAYAQQEGNTWKVTMFGGLARHKQTTADGFALVLCHELGHHLAGAPLYSNRGGWASTEGESDYFGSLKCLRRAWQGDKNTEIVKKLNVPASVSKRCDAQFKTADEKAICKRGAMAGLSLANLLHELGGDGNYPSFETVDPSVVSRTYEGHPEAQCRLDTYYNGATCKVAYTKDIGKSDINEGACSDKNGDKIGKRPKCWFNADHYESYNSSFDGTNGSAVY
jgi:hypothetical protein